MKSERSSLRGVALVSVFAAMGLAACGGGGDDGAGGGGGATPPASRGTLVRTAAEPAGPQCALGGTRIEIGVDDDGDLALGAGEVDETTYVCTTLSGVPNLVRTRAEPAGSNCPLGGSVVETGLDDNRNNVLEAGEVDSTGYVCTPPPVGTGNTWRATTLLETSAASASSVSVAAATNGDAMAIWRQSDGPRLNLWAARYDAGLLAWGTPVLLEHGDGGDVGPGALVAMDVDGNALVTWTQSDGAAIDLWSNRFDAATKTWGGAQRLASSIGVRGAVADMAFDAAGNAILIWVSSNAGGTRNLQASRYDAAAAAWQAPALLETDEDNSVGGGRLAVDRAGNALVVWSQFDGAWVSLFSARYRPAAGTWEAPLALESLAGDVGSMQVAINDSGRAAVIWHLSDVSGMLSDTYASLSTAGLSGWNPPVALEAAAPLSVRGQVVLDGFGDATFAWWEVGTNALRTVRYTPADGAWTELPQVPNALFAQLALDGVGNVHAVWLAGSWDVAASRLDRGAAGWSVPVLLEGDAGQAMNPSLAVAPDGRAAAAWTQQGTSEVNALASVYR